MQGPEAQLGTKATNSMTDSRMEKQMNFQMLSKAAANRETKKTPQLKPQPPSQITGYLQSRERLGG